MEKGKIIQVSGPVIDVLFEKGNLPHIKDALKVDNHGKECVMEVAKHMGHNVVRCIIDVYKRQADQVALAAGDGYIPWLEPGIYENYFMETGKKEVAKEAQAFYDWRNELKFSKDYSLTCESDPDSHMMQMMNLWYCLLYTS